MGNNWWFLFDPKNIFFLKNNESIIFIYKTDSTDPLKKEQYWGHTLKTLLPYGLNVSESLWLHDIGKLL